MKNIPDLIWGQVFSLMESTPELEALQALGINPLQPRNKRLDRQATLKTPRDIQPLSQRPVGTKPVEFCEATPKYPLVGKPAKAFDTTTLVRDN